MFMIESFRTGMEIKQRNNDTRTVDILERYGKVLIVFKTTISVETTRKRGKGRKRTQWL